MVVQVHLLDTVVAVVAVLAAQSVTVNSSINVQYTSSEVAADVTGAYVVHGGTPGSSTAIGTAAAPRHSRMRIQASISKLQERCLQALPRGRSHRLQR